MERSDKKPNVIKDKTFEFSLEIISLYKTLVNDRKEFVISKQLLRSGTSIGANIREAEFAQSKADFIHKFSIAIKEANETDYWLELLSLSNYISAEEFQVLKPRIVEILKICTSIINSSKNNY